MPIIERDPWRDQYFEEVACPDDVVIPTDDEHAYELWPGHRWVYNKLLICDTQGVPGAPHGVAPPRFPVFSKPIYTMSGMGVDGRIIRSAAELAAHLRPGHMWMALLEGEHVSSDVVVVDGEPRWWRHSVGRTLPGGTFDYWTILAEHRPDLEDYCGAWLRDHLHGYTGAVNLETIGGTVIEAHLRFADQWPDLYGHGWLDAIVELYTHGDWSYPDDDRAEGHSVVLFGPHGGHPVPPPAALVDDLVRRPGISSIQVTFHPDRDPARHAMPPGGFRLAVVNSRDLGAGRAAREELERAFRWNGTLSPRTQTTPELRRAG